MTPDVTKPGHYSTPTSTYSGPGEDKKLPKNRSAGDPLATLTATASRGSTSDGGTEKTAPETCYETSQDPEEWEVGLLTDEDVAIARAAGEGFTLHEGGSKNLDVSEINRVWPPEDGVVRFSMHSGEKYVVSKSEDPKTFEAVCDVRDRLEGLALAHADGYNDAPDDLEFKKEDIAHPNPPDLYGPGLISVTLKSGEQYVLAIEQHPKLHALVEDAFFEL